ncbi:cell division protein FtsQ [Blastococcus sp. TF02-8]|uniref:cell division protein FtsQ/DivIB n=1 Tax=Blastococcus sp. TF02-8 TaxID=2250574 RepID=UPI000DE89792|nr:FtsQ-type POTRA domain-containing protein [Blastococcus sp. TF02-8]RBY95622.1 cell division protein FtsQ [Blastococcus sp. TF02-8]
MTRSGSTTRDRTGRTRRPAGRRGGGATPLPNRRRPLRPRQRRALQGATLVTVLAVLGWLLWLGPVLAVRTVQVDGLDALAADEVRAAAQVPDGVPLLRVDIGAVEDRVARMPQVRSVQAARGWPDRIVITVAERIPVAVVGERGRRSLVDADGVLFDTLTGDAPRGVVPLEVADPGTDDPATRAGIAAIRALPASFRDDVERVAVPDPEAIELTMRDGTAVRWGSAEQSAAKSQIVVALLGRIGDGELDPAAVIDVSAPDAVVLR